MIVVVSPPVSRRTGSNASALATAPMDSAPVRPSSHVAADCPALRLRACSDSEANMSGKKAR